MSLSYLFCFLLLNTSSIALLIIDCMVCLNRSCFALLFSTRSIRCWLLSAPRVHFKISSGSYFLRTGFRRLLSSLSTIFLSVLFQSPGFEAVGLFLQFISVHVIFWPFSQRFQIQIRYLSCRFPFYFCLLVLRPPSHAVAKRTVLAKRTVHKLDARFEYSAEYYIIAIAHFSWHFCFHLFILNLSKTSIFVLGSHLRLFNS